MKFLILTLFCLSATLCSREQEPYHFVNYQIENYNIINVANSQNTYMINDDLFISSILNYDQNTVNNELINLSDIEIQHLNYNIVLYKLTNYGTLSKIPLTSSVINTIDGDVTINDYDNTLSITLEDTGLEYKANFSIKLLETGTYYLGGTNVNQNMNYQVEIYGFNNQTNTQLLIKSNFVNANTDGLFEFIVN